MLLYTDKVQVIQKNFSCTFYTYISDCPIKLYQYFQYIILYTILIIMNVEQLKHTSTFINTGNNHENIYRFFFLTKIQSFYDSLHKNHLSNQRSAPRWRIWSMTSKDQDRSAFSTWVRLWSFNALITGRSPQRDTEAMTITYCPRRGGKTKDN